MTGSRPLSLEVRADGARCCGAGHCVRIAPQVFDQNERDGTVILLQPYFPESLEPLVREAAALCPTHAIIVNVLD
jgi:ferredoxin